VNISKSPCGQRLFAIAIGKHSIFSCIYGIDTFCEYIFINLLRLSINGIYFSSTFTSLLCEIIMKLFFNRGATFIKNAFK